jgi:hypothetical protein
MGMAMLAGFDAFTCVQTLLGIATLIAEAVVLAFFACVTVQAVRKFHPSAA